MTIRCLFLSAWFLIPAAGLAQFGGAVDGSIIFKDGFTIHGRIIQQKKFEIDPVSGSAYAVPAGFTIVDDDVRRIYFPPAQIIHTKKKTPGELVKELMFLHNPITHTKPFWLPGWRFKEAPLFNKNWEREIEVLFPDGSFKMHQRIVQLSPYRVRIQALRHNWEINYFTKELNINDVIKLVRDYMDVWKAYKDYSPAKKSIVVATFYQQMGRLDDAENLAKEILASAPEHKKELDAMLDFIAREKAKKFGAEFEPLANAKQHRTILTKLAAYDKGKFIEKVPDDVKLFVQDLKNKYETDNEKLAKVKDLFKFLMSENPEERGFWLNGTTTILDELNYDTLPRLETFLTFGGQYQRDIKEKKAPSQRLEEVLALAMTGWHLGNIAAEPNVKLAHTLWKGRKFVRDYMKADTAGLRAKLAEDWMKEAYLPIDVVARLLQHLPPPNAYPKVSDEPMVLNFDLPDAPQGSYLVKLPPDYHHQRAHPVLMLIHSDREAPEVFLKRWAPLTDVHGFIVIAPLWRNNFKNAYAASDAEHIYFLNCLKDLKRRFQVDTDRVFLFGWANGAQIAWDVGLAHPDQFAGLLPMCGVPNAFSKNYSLNAQNLGLYIVDGDKSGNGPVVTRDMFKDWIRFNYNAYYLEYKGRANELYLGEFEPMMDWMSRKKRQYPMKQLGSFSNTNSVAEEFRTHRQSDNRFYWLSTDELNDNNKQDAFNWVANRSAAKLQATIGVSNSGDTKGNARIETIVSVRANGVKQCTVWLAPSMIDFSKPVQLRVNNRAIRGPQTMTPSIPIMLGEYHQTVDRQRLYYARIDAKL